VKCLKAVIILFYFCQQSPKSAGLENRHRFWDISCLAELIYDLINRHRLCCNGNMVAYLIKCPVISVCSILIVAGRTLDQAQHVE